MEYLKKIYDVFSRFDRDNILYCHWKSIDHLDATYRGETDIDVLFSRKHRSSVEKILSDCGFILLNTDVLRAYPGILDYVAFDEEHMKWVHLHLHYSLNMGDRWVKSYHPNLEEFVLQNRVWNDQFQTFTINPHDELSVLIARMSLKFVKPFSSSTSIDELNFLVDQISNVERPISSFQLTHAWREAVEMFYSEAPHDLDLINKKARFIRKEFADFRRLSYLHFIILSAVRAIYRYHVEFRRRFLAKYSYGRRAIPHGGYIVAFVGIDGSGKTSAISRLAEFFKLQINVEVAFLGNGLSGASFLRKLIFNVLRKVGRWKKHKKYRNQISTEMSSPPLYYLLWMLITLLDKKRNMNRIIKAAANGKLVLVDRWPQNAVENTLDGRRIKRRPNMSLIERFIYDLEDQIITLAERYHPDLIIKLMVTPSVAISRKPNEFSEEVAAENLKKLRDLDYLSSKIVTVDADVATTNVDAKCTKVIWDVIKGD